MQLANCTVLLGGSPLRTVRRINVTVPELLLLRAIHGESENDESVVVDIEVAGERELRNEKDELLRFYGSKDELVTKIEKLFPGARPNIPQTFAEIGVGDAGAVATEAEPAPIQPKPGELIKPPKAKEKKQAVLA